MRTGEFTWPFLGDTKVGVCSNFNWVRRVTSCHYIVTGRRAHLNNTQCAFLPLLPFWRWQLKAINWFHAHKPTIGAKDQLEKYFVYSGIVKVRLKKNGCAFSLWVGFHLHCARHMGHKKEGFPFFISFANSTTKLGFNFKEFIWFV